jgi:broad specificity phosphatase PhoE
VRGQPPTGDAPLTAHGEEEARQLGEYWAPILQSKASSGSILAFVSPQIRCMSTADAVLRRLGCRAQVQFRTMWYPVDLARVRARMARQTSGTAAALSQPAMQLSLTGRWAG